MSKKLTSILICFTIILTFIPSVSAFDFLGIDFSEIFSSLFGGGEESLQNNETTNEPYVGSRSEVATNPNSSVILAGVNYSESYIKESINSQENIKRYIRGLGYGCVYVRTEQGEEFTLFFNTETGEITELELGQICEREITIDDTLITDLKNEGLQPSKIRSYLEKVELPTLMYLKILKVVVVG